MRHHHSLQDNKVSICLTLLEMQNFNPTPDVSDLNTHFSHKCFLCKTKFEKLSRAPPYRQAEPAKSCAFHGLLVYFVWFQPYLWMKPQVVIRCIRDAIQNTSLVYTFDRIPKSFSMLSSSFPFSKLYSNISKIEAADCGLPCP